MNLFIFNLVFNNLIIDFLLKRDLEVTSNALTNLQNDFISISFPVAFQINSLLISFILSILIAIIIKFFVLDQFNLDDPINIIKSFLKLFFVYTGSLFSVLYLLRIYNLSRGLVIVSIVGFTLLSFLFVLLLHFGLKKTIGNSLIGKSIPVFILLLLISIFFFQRNTDEDTYSVEAVPATSSTIFSGVVNEDCKEWKGSDNFSNCVSGVEIEILDSFPNMVTNVIVYEDIIYLLENSGKIFNHTNNEVFLDLSSKVGVFEDFAESGLFSLAFHPTNEYLVVSYSDLENNLIVESYNLNSSFEPDVTNPVNLIKLPSSQCCHYSGNLIWSTFFDDFLLSVGDMQNKNGLLHSEPLDTTSPKGKILFLNKKISNPDLLSLENTQTPRNDILAYGLRNPWKTFVYKNYLFVPDVGKANEEELNVVDLNDFKATSKPYLFGWPHYEGSLYYELVFNQILYHDGESSVNIRNYVQENTILPNVYYSHQAPENFRAAIIGGGLIEDVESEYFEYYFFADYLSNELFSYEFMTDRLTMYPLNNVGGYITSVAINPYSSDSILITTTSGNLLQINLP